MMRAKTTLRERFERNVVRDLVTGCWRWQGNLNKGTAGNFYVGGDATKPVRTVAWELEHGPVPEGKFVAPMCADRRCIAPAHAELRVRAPRLTPDVVRDIRRRRAAGESIGKIARRYALAKASTHAIVHGFTHKEIR